MTELSISCFNLNIFTKHRFIKAALNKLKGLILKNFGSLKTIFLSVFLAFSATSALAQQKGIYKDADSVANGVIGLQSSELKTNSPAMRKVLASTFPARPINSSSSSVSCASQDSEPCQWYGVGDPDEESPWPGLMMWFKAGQILSVTLASPNPFERSSNWDCVPLKGSGDMVDCFHADTPAATVKKFQRLHAKFLSSAG